MLVPLLLGFSGPLYLPVFVRFVVLPETSKSFVTGTVRIVLMVGPPSGIRHSAESEPCISSMNIDNPCSCHFPKTRSDGITGICCLFDNLATCFDQSTCIPPGCYPCSYIVTLYLDVFPRTRHTAPGSVHFDNSSPIFST